MFPHSQNHFIFKNILLFGAFFFLLINIDSAKSQLPVPSLISEIRPTLSIYSPGGDPPCFTLPDIEGHVSFSSRDLAHISAAHGAWNQVARAVFITHSFKESGNTPWLHILKNAILQKHPGTTVVIVGWGGGSGSNDPEIGYKEAASNIKSVGLWLGEIVGELRRINPSLYLHGVGHSLGAHLMGIAGRVSGAFDRVTGLDPAAPFFHRLNFDIRLQRGDAAIVDILHSDGCIERTTPNCWVTVSNHYALLTPLGTVDFYPGYGELNPNPEPLEIGESHTRAVTLFIMSVLNPGMLRTNDILAGHADGVRTSTRIRSVQVTAEMGYWLSHGFIPKPLDARTSFYIPREKLEVVNDMGESLMTTRVRRRRVVDVVDCLVVPSGERRLIDYSSVPVILVLMSLASFLKLKIILVN